MPHSTQNENYHWQLAHSVVLPLSILYLTPYPSNWNKPVKHKAKALSVQIVIMIVIILSMNKTIPTLTWHWVCSSTQKGGFCYYYYHFCHFFFMYRLHFSQWEMKRKIPTLYFLFAIWISVYTKCTHGK